MKRLFIFLMLPLIFTPVGYILGNKLPATFMQEDLTSIQSLEVNELLYKMPLGGLAVQVLQRESIVHIVFDVDIYILGATEFEHLSGAGGKARLRDAAITAFSELAENTLWIKEEDEHSIKEEQLEKLIAKKLFTEFSSVRSAKINKLVIVRRVR
jgi:hypothetical protein